MIIGLYGWSRSGKDTIADRLVEKHGYTKISMTDTLGKVAKDIAKATIPALYEHIEEHGWESAKDVHALAVPLLIAVGQSARDHIDADIWIRDAMERADGYDKVVIPNIRQPNEIQWLRYFNGAFIRVNREGAIKHGMDGLLDGYPADIDVDNNKSIEHLHKTVDFIAQDILVNNTVDQLRVRGGLLVR